MTTLLFAFIYKALPDVKIAWSDVAIGAIVTSALFTLGKMLIALYLVLRRRWWHFAAFVSAVVVAEACVGPIKSIYDRARRRYRPHPGNGPGNG